MLHPDTHMEVARSRCKERLAHAEHARMVQQLRPHRTLARPLARWLGHALFSISTRLLRYGQADLPLLVRLDRSAQQQRTHLN